MSTRKSLTLKNVAKASEAPRRWTIGLSAGGAFDEVAMTRDEAVRQLFKRFLPALKVKHVVGSVYAYRSAHDAKWTRFSAKEAKMRLRAIP